MSKIEESFAFISKFLLQGYELIINKTDNLNNPTSYATSLIKKSRTGKIISLFEVEDQTYLQKYPYLLQEILSSQSHCKIIFNPDQKLFQSRIEEVIYDPILEETLYYLIKNYEIFTDNFISSFNHLESLIKNNKFHSDSNKKLILKKES